MTYLHKASGHEFEIGQLVCPEGKDYVVTIITRWNNAEYESVLSPITLVGYYFGDANDEDTEYYINRWLSGVREGVHKLDLACDYLQAYYETNEDVLDAEDKHAVRLAKEYCNELLTKSRLLATKKSEMIYEQLTEFKKWFDDLLGPSATEESIEALYDKPITITVNGKSIDLCFDAENYNNIEHVLSRAIEEF